MLGSARCGVYGASGGGGAGGAYTPTGYVFDGAANHWYTRGAKLTGSADSKVGTVAFGLLIPIGAATGYICNQQLSSIANDGIRVLYSSSGANVRIRGFAPTERLDVNVAASADGVLRHYYATWDLDNSSNRSFLINGVTGSPSWDTYSAIAIDSDFAEFSIGAQSDGSSPLQATLYDFFYDLSYDAGIANFYADGAMLDPATSWPSGLVKFYGGGATNQGSGGGFTEQT